MHAAVVRFRPLLINLAAPVLFGSASARLSGNNEAFYDSLWLPAWAPPGAVFGVVWTVLYLLMGLAAYLVYTAPISRYDRKCAMTFYGFALLTNFLWSFIFFRFRLYTLAAWWIVIVLTALALCTMAFWRIRPWAGRLLAPTLLWLACAGALNFAVAAMN